jgi:phosphatidylinositol alpha-1,6-mannosyltransferase
MTNVTDRLDVRGLRLASAIQVENLWMLDYAELVNSGRLVDLRYAPPGINACVFRPSPERSANNMNYILCVGRLDDPRKNLDLLLSAYAFLPETLRDRVCLVLAGSSSPPTVFWQRAEELGVRQRVSFVSRPSRDELVRLYQSASVFVLPSDEEGFGVVLLEAMACAVPAVATRCGGPEGIITDGQDGFLVALNDVQKMTERLRLLLEDGQLNDTMGRRARRTIEERFDESVAGAEFLDMWDSLVRKQDPHEANGNVNPK